MQALVDHLMDAHQRLTAALGRLKDEELLEYPVLGVHRTLLELIFSAGSAHEAHHAGQISYLRGLQNALMSSKSST